MNTRHQPNRPSTPFSILSLLFLCAFLPTATLVSAADDPKPPATILAITDYRGQIGPFTQFSLINDATWTYTVKKGGKKVETRNGKLTVDESNALVAFIKGLALEKHTRNRKVEDAAMFSVQLGQVQFIDIEPEPAANVMNKIKEVTDSKEAK